MLTLFPGMFGGVLGESMLGRAAEAGLLEFHLHDIRAFTDNRHNKGTIIRSAAAPGWS